MIAALLAAALAITPSSPPTAPPDIPPLRARIAPGAVLERYAAALAAQATPSVISFEYVLSQTGARDLQQTHRVFRSGTDQRDEILSVDGRRLEPPPVRITRHRRDRYALAALAPHVGAYAFKFIGAKRDARHQDYVFATTPHTPSGYRVTAVTIDGAGYLPNAISFTTSVHGGSGTVTFVRAGTYWVPAVATARGTYANLATREKISFMSYRFPPSLPPGTFAKPRPVPALKPPT